MQMFKYLYNDSICCLLPHLYLPGPYQSDIDTRLLNSKEETPEEKRVTLTSYVVKGVGSHLNRESEMTTFQLSI